MPLLAQQTHVFIVCFALDNRASFENVSSKWLPELKQHCPKAPVVLVGEFFSVSHLALLNQSVRLLYSSFMIFETYNCQCSCKIEVMC